MQSVQSSVAQKEKLQEVSERQQLQVSAEIYLEKRGTLESESPSPSSGPSVERAMRKIVKALRMGTDRTDLSTTKAGVDQKSIAGGMQLAIKGQDGNVVHLSIEKQARLEKLMKEYGKRTNFFGFTQSWEDCKHKIRFIFAGKTLRETQTAGELKMQGGDVIEARLGTRDSNVCSIPPCFPRLLWCFTRTVLHAQTQLHTTGI